MMEVVLWEGIGEDGEARWIECINELEESVKSVNIKMKNNYFKKERVVDNGTVELVLEKE